MKNTFKKDSDANMKTVRIFDTTLRDGEQAPGASLNPEEKIRVAKQLAKLGVDVIEPGFPVSSPREFYARSTNLQNAAGGGDMRI